jgi:hypothetical protein
VLDRCAKAVTADAAGTSAATAYEGDCAAARSRQLEITDQVVVAKVEVLGILTRLQPDERWRQSVENKSGHRLPLCDRKLFGINHSYDQVQKVFLTFKLVPVLSDRARKLVGLNPNVDEGIPITGAINGRIKNRQFDRLIGVNQF